MYVGKGMRMACPLCIIFYVSMSCRVCCVGAEASGAEESADLASTTWCSRLQDVGLGSLVLSPLAVHPCILEWFYKTNNILSSACVRPFLLLYNNTTYNIQCVSINCSLVCNCQGGGRVISNTISRADRQSWSGQWADRWSSAGLNNNSQETTGSV